MSDLLNIETLSTLKEVIGDDLNEIIDSFIELLPSQLAAIEAAIHSGNATELRSQTHTLKGSSSNVGATALSALAYQLETLGKQGDTTSARTISAPLRQLAKDTEQALRHFMAS
jgi:HPt (histidine-containing phosphotransfer) domain-containing protein